jgi:hypothetical protein
MAQKGAWHRFYQAFVSDFMIETIELIFKCFAAFLKLLVDSGKLFDASLSKTGRYTIKAMCPHHWGKQKQYNQKIEYLVGLVMWCAVGYAIVLLNRTI